MTDSPFKPGQTYKTRGGREALIYCNDAPGDYPVHGRIDTGVVTWTGSGCSSIGFAYSSSDLIPPAPPRIREMGWCNLWRDGSISFYRSQADAEYAAGAYCIRTAVLCMVDEIVDGEPGK